MIKIVTALVVGVIVVGILCHLLGANASNGVVSTIYDIDRFLVGPFRGLFTLKDAKAEIAVNWGIAAVVYAVVGALIARLLTAASVGGGRSRWRRPAY